MIAAALQHTSLAEKIDNADREAEIIGRLVAHVMAVHSGDRDAKETTLALLLEHMHYQHQRGIRDSADSVQRIADAMTGDRRRTLTIAADALVQWADKNDAGRKTFGEG